MRILLLTTLLLSSNLLFGQKIELKWKIRDNEILSYKTAMEPIDTNSFKSIKFNAFNQMFDALPDSISSGEKSNTKKDINDFFNSINNQFKTYSTITTLKKDKNGSIDVLMFLEKNLKENPDQTNKDSITQMFSKLIELMSKNAVLRGKLSENGKIESFYMRSNQKNLLALMFELPGKQVKVGDHWGLEVNLLTMDQNFTCEKADKRNKASLIEIKREGKEQVAIIKYDIHEYVDGIFNNPMTDKSIPTKMEMSFSGLGEFSIEKGRWINFNAILSYESSGFMDGKQKQRFSLKPITE